MSHAKDSMSQTIEIDVSEVTLTPNVDITAMEIIRMFVEKLLQINSLGKTIRNETLV